MKTTAVIPQNLHIHYCRVVADSRDTNSIVCAGSSDASYVSPVTVDIVRGGTVAEIDVAYYLIGQVRVVQVNPRIQDGDIDTAATRGHVPRLRRLDFDHPPLVTE